MKGAVAALNARVALLESQMRAVDELKLDVARLETRLDALIEHVRDLTASIRWMREPADSRSPLVAADVKSAVDAVTAGLKWFEVEAKLAIAWIDRSIPGAQTALAALFQTADTAAATLQAHALTGLADV